MRSFILTAAIAAALLSTSLTAGYAASPGKGGASSGGASTHATRSEGAPASRAAAARADRAIEHSRTPFGGGPEEGDPVPPVTIYGMARGCSTTSATAHGCR
jgi:hypothetical protein